MSDRPHLLWMCWYRLREVTPVSGPPVIGQCVTITTSPGLEPTGRVIAVVPAELTHGVGASLVMWDSRPTVSARLMAVIENEDFGIRSKLRSLGLEDLADV